MMTKAIDIDYFYSKMLSGGIWCINEASETMKNYVRRISPMNFFEAIKKYETRQKFILEGEKLVVVSLTEADWGGIVSYTKEDYLFKDNASQLLFIRNLRKAHSIISLNDYQVTTGEYDITTSLGNVIKVNKMEISDAYYKALIGTNYITQEEIDKYNNHDVFYDLPRVKTLMM